MSDKDLYEGLSREEIEALTEEARQRWGDTKAFKQSTERYGKMSQEEKDRIAGDIQENMRQFAEAMPQGSDSEEIQRLIDEQYRYINEKFYDCGLEMFYNLAVMSVEDERYASAWRKYHPELPEFRLEAVKIYCERNK